LFAGKAANTTTQFPDRHLLQKLAAGDRRSVAGVEEVIAHLEHLTATGSPAMQSRGRKLLARLAQLGESSPAA
jgi:hypothetical protein